MKKKSLTLLIVALVLLAAGLGALGVKLWLFPAPVLRLVYRVKLEPGSGPSRRTALLEQTLEVMRRRAEPVRGRVTLANERILVDLPRLAPGDLRAAQRRLVRSVKLELRRVDDRSDLLRRIVAAEPPPEGVEVKRNDYSGRGGKTVSYVTLTAVNRRRLEVYLDGLSFRYRPKPDRQLVLGEGWGPHGRATQYEVFHLHRKVELGNRDVVAAEVFIDEVTGRPDVGITFSKAGARRFESLTRAIVGQRLAILLDGKVSSAPVVQEPITGGKARITLGGFKDPMTRRLEAEELALALDTGVLPVKLELESEEAL
jgi:preprotein translocase subunit SecD